MLKRIAVSLVIVIVAATILAGSIHVYYLRSDAVGELFWNQREAYLFVQISDTGYRMTYLGLLGETAREVFPFAVPKPENNHFSVVVLRITPNSVDRYATDNLQISQIEPFEQTLYSANLLSGTGLMKWSGTRFETATQEEATRYYGNAKSLPSGPSYDDVQGWSKRTAAGDVKRVTPTDYAETDSTVTLKLDGEEMTFIMNSGFITHQAYVRLNESQDHGPGSQEERR
jgi:hypothetical protein